MNKKVKIFIAHALAEMIENKVDIKLPRTKKVSLVGSLRCNGYFDLGPPQFCVGMKKPEKDWLRIFVHEYCHFKQWIDKELVFTNFDKIDGMDNYDDWVNHEAELTKKQILECTRAIQALELNCEKRVVDMIKLFQLPINIHENICRANAYVLFYNYVMKHRYWSGKVSPYEPKGVLRVTPNVWLRSYKTMTPVFEEAIHKYVEEAGR